MIGGIKISCQHKRELCLTLGNSNDPDLKYYYKTYCKILANVIKAAKNLFFFLPRCSHTLELAPAFGA
jgi:hypothetical protein